MQQCSHVQNVLKRNKNFLREGKYKLDVIIFRVIDVIARFLAQIEAVQLSWIGNITKL